MASTTLEDKEMHVCIVCKTWIERSKVRFPTCKDCKRRKKRLERKAKTIKCGVPGCNETLISGSNRKYCYLHKGLTPAQRRIASEKLLQKQLET